MEHERQGLFVAHADVVEGDDSLPGPFRSRLRSARVVFSRDAVDILAAPLDGDELLLGLGEDPGGDSTEKESQDEFRLEKSLRV